MEPADAANPRDISRYLSRVLRHEPECIGLSLDAQGWAALRELAIRRQIAPNLIAGNNDLKQLIRGKLQGAGLPANVLLGQGWRGQHILPELEAILAGEKRVRVADMKAEGPLDYD